MLREAYTCPEPVIACVNGPAIGGGAGIVAACDISIASEDAGFAKTETTLEITPAAISPHLFRRMGESDICGYVLTGCGSRRRASPIGMANATIPAEKTGRGCPCGGQDDSDR